MINKMDICDFIKEHSDDKDAVLVDVRDKTLYEFGSVPGAVNIPIAHPSLLYELPKDKTVYVFCQVGEISGEIAELLSDAGYIAYNLTGGYREYLRNHIELKERCE